MKYVLVSGGVISGIGKGVIASSTGLLLKTIGLKVSSIKVDPYMNVDAGTMAPTEHGEVFVLDDGGEVDLDLGNYERYLNITLTRENNITTGKIYLHVIEKERKGDYLGRTVQVVPHITDAIRDWIERVSRVPVDDTNEEPDVCIIELGGTVGDIESGPFIEAMRSLRRKAGKNNFLQIHVSLVPLVGGEQKTKPTQQAIRDVRSAGLSPDLIACRCTEKLERSTIDKIAHWCQVEEEQVLAVHDVSTTYHVPILLEEQGLLHSLSNVLQLNQLQISQNLVTRGRATWKEWRQLTTAQERLYDDVTIALVGKYTNLHDSYLSVIKSLEHAAMHCHRKLKLIWVDASHLEKEAVHTDPAAYHKAWHEVCTAQGILVPGGFGHRGTEGMIAAANWAREKKIPFLGVCLGMQLAVVEYARNVCGLQDALSGEFKNDIHPTENEIIIFMPEIDQKRMGGTMRLGLRPTLFQPASEWSRLRRLYSAGSSRATDGGRSFRLSAPTPTRLGAPPSAPQTNGTQPPPQTLHNTTTTTTSPTTSQPQQPKPPILTIYERHRHRYEVNPKYIDRLQAAGMHFVGKDESGARMEIVELKEHPYYVGVQFHPEYLSRVLAPSQPYVGLVAASAGLLDRFLGGLEGRGGGLMGGVGDGEGESGGVVNGHRG